MLCVQVGDRNVAELPLEMGQAVGIGLGEGIRDGVHGVHGV